MCSAAALANANIVPVSMFSLQGATWPSRHWPSGHLHPELGRLEVAWAIRLRWNQVWGWIFCDLWQSCLSVLVFPACTRVSVVRERMQKHWLQSAS
jgi:hypothetical protein